MYAGTHFNDFSGPGKKVTQIFNPRPGRGSNRGPQDWEAEILQMRQPLRLHLGGRGETHLCGCSDDLTDVFQLT